MAAYSNRVEASDGAAAERTRYRAISEYGAIGDCRTAALVAPDGAIDWCCLPHFDSPAIFCRLLDADRGGYFRLAPRETSQTTARYLDGTNVLETTFETDTGQVKLRDFVPIRSRRQPPLGEVTHWWQDVAASLGLGNQQTAERNTGNDVAAAHRLTRIATVEEGQATFDLTLHVTFDYARQPAEFALIALDAEAAGAVLWAGERYLAFVLRREGGTPASDADGVRLVPNGTMLQAQVPARAGERVVALLNYARSRTEAEALVRQLARQNAEADQDETLRYWRDWSGQCRYQGPYRHAVLRSALALKLCTFEPTGAIVAAPTTSLPEAVGGARNWDYRFTWLRDSAFTLDALDALGYQQEARDYFHFLHDLHLRNGTDLRIMYTIHGQTGAALAEEELPHLAGYRDSRPVRIGKGAASQRQLDVYGELLNAAYRYLVKSGFTPDHRRTPANRNVLPLITEIADYVTDHWQDLDQGIWEVRGAPRAFVYSQVMCWAALNRACEVADGTRRARWAAARDAIQADVLAHGYDPARNTFVQAYGEQALDAANLRLPLVNFLPATDPRMVGTLDATMQELMGPRDLLYRYRTTASDDAATSPATTHDGLAGSEGAFTICTCWLITDLCEQGRNEEARRHFEALLRFASPLGLFAEEIDFATGAQLGNFPQALTHIGLINAAVRLDQ